MDKIKKLLHSNKGESLIESLISILIFSLLIVTVTLTIATALRITASATGDAFSAQERVNHIIEERAGTFGGDDIVRFDFTYQIYAPNAAGTLVPSGTPVERYVEHDVDTQQDPGRQRLAFRPSTP